MSESTFSQVGAHLSGYPIISKAMEPLLLEDFMKSSEVFNRKIDMFTYSDSEVPNPTFLVVPSLFACTTEGIAPGK